MSYDDSRGSGSGCSTTVVVVGIIGAVILGIVLVCGGVAYYTIRSVAPSINAAVQMVQDIQKSQQAAYAFLEDIHADRLDDAYERTTPAFQTRVTRKNFDELVRRYPVLQRHDFKKTELHTEIPEVRPEPGQIPPIPDVSSMPYTLQLENPDGESIELTLVVVKQGDSFKVDKFEVGPPAPKTKPSPRQRRGSTSAKTTAPERKKMEKAEE
jgi:hypothetical protein